jgi:hypothetical protein
MQEDAEFSALPKAALVHVGFLDPHTGLQQIAAFESAYPKAAIPRCRARFWKLSDIVYFGLPQTPLQARFDEPVAGADHVESYRRGDRGSPRIF